ncbi:hypothetical protein [Streptomyces sp. NPDC059176]
MKRITAFYGTHSEARSTYSPYPEEMRRRLIPRPAQLAYHGLDLGGTW